jgi:hypothetical protein
VPSKALEKAIIRDAFDSALRSYTLNGYNLDLLERLKVPRQRGFQLSRAFDNILPEFNAFGESRGAGNKRIGADAGPAPPSSPQLGARVALQYGPVLLVGASIITIQSAGLEKSAVNGGGHLKKTHFLS